MIIDKEYIVIRGRDVIALGDEVLNKNGVFRTQVSGSCIYPLVKDQDFVHIERASSAGLRVGDIVVYRVSEDGLHINPYYKQLNADDPRVFFGKVIAIERDGKVKRLDSISGKLRNLALTVVCLVRRGYAKISNSKQR